MCQTVLFHHDLARKEQCTSVCTKITPALLVTLYLVRIHAAYLIVNLLLVLCGRRFLQVLGEITKPSCFPFFWTTLTPVISCAKPVSVKIRRLPATEAMVADTLVLPDSALNASSVTSSKPSRSRQMFTALFPSDQLYLVIASPWMSASPPDRSSC